MQIYFKRKQKKGANILFGAQFRKHEYVSFMSKKKIKYIYSLRHYYIFETRHQTARHPLMTMKLERKGLETVKGIFYIGITNH